MGTLGGDSQSLIHQNFEFFDEAVPALKKATQNNYLNIIITNQSHISHGRITMEEYIDALDSLLNELKENGALITDVYTCPHARKDNCDCKKPQTKLVEDAVKKYDLDLSKCVVIGDSGKNDMMLAKNAGLESVLVLTGGGISSLTDNRQLWIETKSTFIAENSLEAVNKIVAYI